MTDTRKLTVTCPDCQGQLIVDAGTGEVLAHRSKKKPPAGGKDLDSLFVEMDEGKKRAEELFERSRAALEDEDRLLEEKFKEALKRAEEDPDEEPPVRPWDLD